MKFLLPFLTPTKVLLIDDSDKILNNLELGLSKKIATYMSFNNPFTALSYVNEGREANIPPSKNLWEGFETELLNPLRFERISAVIVDYDMPGLTGIELCEQIKSPHIQKIMLTGAATEKLAIEAFNNKIIDYFVRKDDFECSEKIEKHLNQIQNQYFASLTQELIRGTPFDSLESSSITDPVFIDFFNNFIQQKNICEYYLLDSMGTYVFLSADGQASALFVIDDLSIIDCEQMIPEAERTPDLLQDLYEFKKAICYHEFKGHPEYHPVDWEKFIYPLSSIEGRQKYYWAYAPTLPYLKVENILSFKSYKNSL